MQSKTQRCWACLVLLIVVVLLVLVSSFLMFMPSRHCPHCSWFSKTFQHCACEAYYGPPSSCHGNYIVYFRPRQQTSHTYPDSALSSKPPQTSDTEAAAAILLEEIWKLQEARAKLLAGACGARLIGHTDDSGNEADDMQLALRRADAVKLWFENEGVASDRLSTDAMGGNRIGQICDPSIAPPGDCLTRNNNVIITTY